MAAEAAPPPSLEAQHHDEYIDYSEDDSATPAVTLKGSNADSFLANAHSLADTSEVPETLPLKPDHQIQAIEMQVEADVEAISVAADAQLDDDGLESVAAVDTEAVHRIDAAESEEGYFNEAGNLSTINVTETEGAYINENEINWEEGLSNEQDADQDDSRVKLDNDDWQLVGEEDHAAQDAINFQEGDSERGQIESHEIDQALEDPSNSFGSLDTDLDATAVVDVDPAPEEQQAAGTPDSVADNDVNEIDYHESQDGYTAIDASAEVSDAQLERQDAFHEAIPKVPAEQAAEDHTMGEDHESQPQEDVANNMITADDDDDDDDDDDVNDEEPDGEVADAPDYAAPGEDTSDHEHVEYDDEVLADARSSVSADTPSNGEMEIPDITVSYKGIDYPFFYGSPDSEGKECFFNDLSLLHCKMEGVLAGFRRELASELGPFDELVFQIDELGLEFTESSQPDVFSDITLGQIISVFDSLVKNQNPNASKPLYAYLATRPNCKKRWLSLVDDAYNGKGLDEISFYFASRAQSEALEILDDEPDLIGEEDNADAAAWPQSPGESEHGDQNDDEAQGESAETNERSNEGDDVGDGIAGDDDAQSQDAVDEDPAQPDASAVEDVDAEATMVDTEAALMDESTAVVDVDAVEDVDVVDMIQDQQPEHDLENDQMAEEDDFRNESLVRTIGESAQQQRHFQDGHSLVEISEGSLTRTPFPHFHSHSDVSMAFSSMTDADNTTQAPEVNTSNPLMWDTQEADAFNTEDAQDFAEDEDLAHNLYQTVGGTDENSADKVTPNTSATSTLNGDEEVAYDNELDLNADLPENETGDAEVTGQGDELAEIDWREFTGDGDDVAKSPSISGKRPRSDVDDMLDDDVQKDVKRRRS